MNMADFLEILWNALRGRGGSPIDYVEVYTALGAIIWAFLLFKTFLQEGLQVASGERTELHKILIRYVAVAGAFFAWPVVSDRIFGAVSALVQMFYPSLTSVITELMNKQLFLNHSLAGQESTEGLVSTILGVTYNMSLGLVFTGLGIVVLIVCCLIILLCIMGSVTILAMNMVLAPVFFALAFDKSTINIAQKWFTTMLSYFMLLPLYGAALSLAVAIQASAGALPTGSPGAGQVFAQILGPVLALGVVLATNKIVAAYVGGAVTGNLGGIAMAAAAIASRGASKIVSVGGKAASTTTSGTAPGGTSSGAGGTNGLSATAQAAISKKP